MSTQPPSSTGTSAFTSPSAVVTVDLASLLVDTTGWTQDRLKKEGRVLFEQHCVAPARFGRARTHDGEPVTVYLDAYEHAFRAAASQQRRGWAKDCWDDQRVQRVRWILPVIAGHVIGTTCWLITDHQSPDHPKPIQRLYVVRNMQYVIWLPAKKSGWTFKTAYWASWRDIDRYTKPKTKPGAPAFPPPVRIWSR